MPKYGGKGTMKRPNFVIIMTDTQTRRMVGAYGLAPARTPHLDALAASGMRCETAYTTCPLCTPARGGLFTGLYPASNGAWANNIAPGNDVVHMGEIFRQHGYRAAYTGKWHLDGGGYFGDGEVGGGFEADWWYDGYRYAKDLGAEAFQAYRCASNDEELAAHGLDREENLWGYRVASRAIDFLQSLNDEENFCLVVSFDEPHGPYRCPPAWRGNDGMADIPASPTFAHIPDREPQLHSIHRENIAYDPQRSWADAREDYASIWDCNRWIDTQIGRVVDAIHERSNDDTVIIYTTDHGEQQYDHGLTSKGPMMYDDSTRIPFIIRMPGDTGERVSSAPLSHLDLIPTMLDLANAPIPHILQGVSQASVWRGEKERARDAVFGGFTRFAVNHDSWGALQPIRFVVKNGWKLVIHYDDDDQLFNLELDPHECNNLIADNNSETITIRNQLHDDLLSEMDRTRDPFRGWRWANRPWRGELQKPWYFGGKRRDKPQGFEWLPQPIEAQQ